MKNQASHNPTAWFTVGEAKFVFMFVATFGLYQVYWFYRQWGHVRDATGAKISPAARAIFSLLTCYALFKRILASAAPQDSRATQVNPGLLVLAYVFLSLTFRLPHYWSLTGFLSVLPLLWVVGVANASAASHDPGAGMNRRLTLANWAWIGVTVLLVGGVAWRAFRVTLSSQTYLAQVAAKTNETLPRFLDEQTQLVRTVGSEGLFVYQYRLVKHLAREIDAAHFGAAMKPALAKEACGGARQFLESGVTLRYRYLDKNDADVVSIDVTPKDCGL